MKVIFLDFDGVLNTDAYVRRQGRCGVILDPEKLMLLGRIVRKTDAKIVLSTSWREHWSPVPGESDCTGEEIEGIFRRFRLEIYDKIPHRTRGREGNIRLWLEQYPSVAQYVVLDDLALTGEALDGHLVRTSDYRGGLTEEHVCTAIAILGKEC